MTRFTSLDYSGSNSITRAHRPDFSQTISADPIPEGPSTTSPGSAFFFQMCFSAKCTLLRNFTRSVLSPNSPAAKHPLPCR